VEGGVAEGGEQMRRRHAHSLLWPKTNSLSLEETKSRCEKTGASYCGEGEGL